MKIVIVEDEKEILRGMKEALSELPAVFDEIHAFDNAEQALSAIQRIEPPLVITDIVMQQMSGLELVEQAMTDRYRPKVIVVSGYNNFEYAQRGIKLGITDYILKPFAKEPFRQAVLGVVELIREEEKDARRHEPIAQLGTRALRDKYVYGLCMRSSALQEDSYHRLKFWGLDWLASSAYTVMIIDFAKESRKVYQENEMALRRFAVGNIVEELMSEYPAWVLFPNTLNQWVLITSAEDIDGLTDHIGRHIESLQRYSVCIGISERMNAFQSLAKAYEQAVTAQKASAISGQSFKQQYRALIQETGGAADDVHSLTSSMRSMDIPAVEAGIDAALRTFVMSGRYDDVRDLSQRCLEWVKDLHVALSEQGGKPFYPVSLELWEQLDRCGSLEQIRNCLYDYFYQLSQSLSSEHGNSLIEKMKRLISAHYAENLTLQRLAEQLNLHPVSLSQLFKKECGMNFSEYLTDIRIKEAQRLLRDSSLKIYEIAAAVGYQDLQHFGQVFKKKTGLSPKEFRFGK